ncbi:hypothetical protein KKH23_05085 [Patescibacteria group bacterium]|nr:hypothetical protein [Patescibacteria group bacterium]MBU1067250.1 hypothetical protein [Patescibacteria group bacterium]
MATLTAQTISRSGLKAVYSVAASGGDEFANTGSEFIHVKNDDGSSHTVTIETVATVDGLAVADRDLAVPAGEDRMIGPFPTGTYNDSDGKAQLTYDAVTSVTIAVLKPGS